MNRQILAVFHAAASSGEDLQFRLRRIDTMGTLYPRQS